MRSLIQLGEKVKQNNGKENDYQSNQINDREIAQKSCSSGGQNLRDPKCRRLVCIDQF
jgi:hypothetical protein